MDPQAETSRTRFLHKLYADEEAGRLAPLDDYVREHDAIAEFVRAEYEALLRRAETGASAASRYRPIEVIGRGGMGEVVLAEDLVLGRKVALKSLRAVRHEPRAVERLRREARVLGRLDHAAICRILDFVEQDGALTLVLPFLQGEPLAAPIERARAAVPRPAFVELAAASTTSTNGRALRGALPTLLAFVARVADAVHEAHRAGVVHRDLKPANIFVLPGGDPMVLDFGLALEAGEDDQRLTLTGEQIGTPYYMAPEQIDGAACDARTDVYALGVMLYELLTLERPFAAPTREGTFRKILAGAIVPLRNRNPSVPRDLEAVCLRACERDPARRYASAAELAEELRRVLQLQPTIARPVGFLRRSVGALRQHRVMELSALVVLVSGLAWWQWVSMRLGRIEQERSKAAVVVRVSDAVAPEIAGDRVVPGARIAGPDEPLAVLSPLGDYFSAPVSIALNRAPSAATQIIVRNQDAGAPWCLEIPAGQRSVRFASGQVLHKDFMYRIYIGSESAGSRKPDAQFSIKGRPGQPSGETHAVDAGDPAMLEVVMKLMGEEQLESALQILHDLNPDSMPTKWLGLAVVSLHAEVLRRIGGRDDDLAAVLTSIRERDIEARYERLCALIKRMTEWTEGGEWTDAKKAVTSMLTLFPARSADGVWARITVARNRLTQFYDAEEARRIMDGVVADLKADLMWGADDCERVNKTFLAPVQEWRPQAATPTDALAQAYLLRGFIENQLEDYAHAIVDLEMALPLFTQTDCAHRIANCYQELAEACLMSGDPRGDTYADEAERRFDAGWVEVKGGSVHRDPVGVASIARIRAHVLRKQGDYARAAPGYLTYLQVWTHSADPISIEEPDLLNLDYHLPGAWYCECMLMQDDPAQQAIGRKWFAKIDGDAKKGSFQHRGFLARLAIDRAILLWRDHKLVEAREQLDNAMRDEWVSKGDLADMKRLLEHIR